MNFKQFPWPAGRGQDLLGKSSCRGSAAVLLRVPQDGVPLQSGLLMAA